MEHVTEYRRDVVELASTNDQTGGSVQDHLQSTYDLCWHAAQDTVAVVGSAGNKSDSQSTTGISW